MKEIRTVLKKELSPFSIVMRFYALLNIKRTKCPGLSLIFSFSPTAVIYTRLYVYLEVR